MKGLSLVSVCLSAGPLVVLCGLHLTPTCRLLVPGFLSSLFTSLFTFLLLPSHLLPFSTVPPLPPFFLFVTIFYLPLLTFLTAFLPSSFSFFPQSSSSSISSSVFSLDTFSSPQFSFPPFLCFPPFLLLSFFLIAHLRFLSRYHRNLPHFLFLLFIPLHFSLFPSISFSYNFTF